MLRKNRCHTVTAVLWVQVCRAYITTIHTHTQVQNFSFSSTLSVVSTLPLSCRHKRQIHVIGLTTPINQENQKTHLGEQKGRWMVNIHIVNNNYCSSRHNLSFWVFGYTHILGVALSKSMEVLHPHFTDLQNTVKESPVQNSTLTRFVTSFRLSQLRQIQEMKHLPKESAILQYYEGQDNLIPQWWTQNRYFKFMDEENAQFLCSITWQLHAVRFLRTPQLWQRSIDQGYPLQFPQGLWCTTMPFRKSVVVVIVDPCQVGKEINLQS